MKYKAVIFDLFGTLVDKVPMDVYYNELRDMAITVSVSPDDFRRWWFDTYDDRGMGKFKSYEANIEYICNNLGIHTDENQIIHAVEIVREYGARYIKPRQYTVELLTQLKSEGYKTGLISDCGVEIPKIMAKLRITPLLDTAVYSCLIGTQKPDPRIYQLTADKLRVRPEECLYIGDGDSHELTGALQVGMHPVLIRNLDEDRNNVYRTNFEGDEWDGPVITSLHEVLDIIRKQDIR